MIKIKISLVILIGISLPLYILWRNIAVSFVYSSLGDPQSGIKLTEKEINGQQFIVLPESENYYFEKIELNIKLKKTVLSKEKTKILVYQDDISAFYPQDEKNINEEELKKMLFENNSTDIPIGGLFASGEAVNIMLPGNFYRTIFSADLFQRRGYRWEDVIPKEIGFTNNLEQKELWRFGDSYTDGTILDINGKKFLIWEEKLFLIQSNVDIKKYTKVTPIKISTVEPKPLGSCEFINPENNLQCSFKKKEDLEKADYVFRLIGLTNQEIQEAQVRVSTSLAGWSLEHNFRASVDNIKLKLIKKYRGYIPFI